MDLVVSGKYFNLSNRAARDVKRDGIRYVFFFFIQYELEFITGIIFYVFCSLKLV
jgi:hypothetical protein